MRSVHSHDGNTADPMTLTAQVSKLKSRFGLSRVLLVGDRGMIRPRSGLMCRKASAALTSARNLARIQARVGRKGTELGPAQE